MSNTTVVNLWPEDFGVAEQTPPVVVLRRQAELLGQRTRNILVGDVESVQRGEWSDIMYHNFYIKAPTLGGYRYKLFYVSHKVASLYPVTLSDHEGELQDEQQLEVILREVFASEQTRKVVQSLMAQSLSGAAA